MVTIENYTDDILSFTNSLVIKSNDIAIAINKGLIEQGGINFISDNKKEWKYFLNIAGEKHYTNNDVMITVIEIGQKRSLTKELLNEYKYTKNELMLNGTFYKELLNEYPEDELFIHGCMYPVDKDFAIKAPDGKILAFNSRYIENQEYELIKELQTYIYNFLTRWNVIEYSIVDELYIPAMYATLYASIPNKIMNIRNDKILTNQAHSFHLEHFFRSKLNIWDEVAILKKQTIYWLYKNIDYLIRNIGKEQTLQLILEKILNTNLIGLGEYILRLPNIKPNTENATDKPTYNRIEMAATPEGLNNFYATDGESVIDLETLINREIKANENQLVFSSENTNPYKNESIINEAKRKINKSYIDKQKTKLLEITTYQLFKRNGIDLFKLLFDYLIYTHKNNTVTYLEEFIDPNNNKSYLCGPYEAILMLVKIIMKMTKTDMSVKIKRLYYDTVLFPDKNCIDTAIKSLFPDGYTNRLIGDLKDNYPPIDKHCSSAIEFRELIETVTTYYNYLWTLDANTESGYVSGNLKMLCQLITDKGYIEISNEEDGELIDDILLKNNINFIVEDNYDLDAMFQTMVTSFTGITIDEYKYIRDTSEGFKSLVNKLTSYTVQIFMADTGEDSLTLKYNNTVMMNAYTGLITLQSGDFIPLEKPDEFKIHAEATIFYDNPIVIPGSNINISASINKLHPVSLNGYNEYVNTDKYWLSPDISGEIYDYRPYPISKK